jgi:23S rRNA (cytosine1962-C5)-methyltransferase
MSRHASTPLIAISVRAAHRLRSGHPWVYRSDLSARTQGETPRAALVHVSDERGNFIASALSSSSSQIALRVITPRRIESDEELLQLIREGIIAASRYRQQFLRDAEAYRVVFSEGDSLGGLIVDRYRDVLVMQALTQAMDRPDVRTAVLAVLHKVFGDEIHVVERVDPRIRELEELPVAESGPLTGSKSSTEFKMNGLVFQFDALAGQKTGGFLDQRENYVAAERYAHGDALDCFCYQGGFALHLARKCKTVIGVDISRAALAAAEANAQRNQTQFTSGEIEWLEGNAFDLLKDYAQAGKQYDTIVLDPPAFAKTKRAVPDALRGYKEINLRALKMLRPGGILVTNSCSHHVSEAEFGATLAEAAANARRTVRILERRTQAIDHPIVATIPETAYLKCWICTAE